jgi:hypothetical protein
MYMNINMEIDMEKDMALDMDKDINTCRNSAVFNADPDGRSEVKSSGVIPYRRNSVNTLHCRFHKHHGHQGHHAQNRQHGHPLIIGIMDITAIMEMTGIKDIYVQYIRH